METFSWIKEKGDQQTLLLVYIQPGASKTEISGLFGESPRLKIKIKAPPRDGEANEEVLRFIGKLLGISKSRVEILRGESSRQKDLLIDLPYEKAIILKQVLV
ncbi:MAG: DUF167 domain-containing protein [Bacteriovoracaceae bacterium]|jgi:uncharacterized protein (TIGR00251 family)